MVFYISPGESVRHMRTCSRSLGGPYAESLRPVAVLVLRTVEIEHRRLFPGSYRVGVLPHHTVVIVIHRYGIVTHP